MAWYPTVGTIVKSSHPITVLNPEENFEVFDLKFNRDSKGELVPYIRGENTCWFHIDMITAV